MFEGGGSGPGQTLRITADEAGENVTKEELSADIKVAADRDAFREYMEKEARIIGEKEARAIGVKILEHLMDFVLEHWPEDATVFGSTVEDGEVTGLEVSMSVDGEDKDGDQYSRDEDDLEAETIELFEEKLSGWITEVLEKPAEDDPGLVEISAMQSGSFVFIDRSNT